MTMIDAVSLMFILIFMVCYHVWVGGDIRLFKKLYIHEDGSYVKWRVKARNKLNQPILIELRLMDNYDILEQRGWWIRQGGLKNPSYTTMYLANPVGGNALVFEWGDLISVLYYNRDDQVIRSTSDSIVHKERVLTRANSLLLVNAILRNDIISTCTNLATKEIEERYLTMTEKLSEENESLKSEIHRLSSICGPGPSDGNHIDGVFVHNDHTVELGESLMKNLNLESRKEIKS